MTKEEIADAIRSIKLDNLEEDRDYDFDFDFDTWREPLLEKRFYNEPDDETIILMEKYTHMILEGQHKTNLLLRGGPERSATWLTNAGKRQAERLLTYYRRYNKGDFFFVGEPQASEAYSVEEMKRQGLVGVYRSSLKLPHIEIEPVGVWVGIWPLLENTLEVSEPENG